MAKLLVEVLTAFNELKLKEAWLEGEPPSKKHPDGTWQYGEQCGDLITVNPIPHVVDTLIHEILHHLYPSWTESQVKRQTTMLLRQLSNSEVRQIYQEFQDRKE